MISSSIVRLHACEKMVGTALDHLDVARTKCWVDQGAGRLGLHPYVL